jgi:hypothetical protein
LSSLAELPSLSYRELVQRIRANRIFQHGFPDSSTESHILPTRRWGDPALCLFSCPSELIDDEPTFPDPPDRWAVFDVKAGALRLFAFTEIFSFTPIPLPPLETKDDRVIPQTMAEARSFVAETMKLMDVLVPKFFVGTDSVAEREIKYRLRDLLSRAPNGVDSWERTMTPDFFDWLDNG